MSENEAILRWMRSRTLEQIAQRINDIQEDRDTFGVEATQAEKERDALRAENEQLRAQLAGQGHALSDRDQRVAELRAVVERLPKTADGVPVVPRMRIWTWGAVTDGSDCGIWHLDVRHVSYGDDYSRFYCTREAAEAARAELVRRKHKVVVKANPTATPEQGAAVMHALEKKADQTGKEGE